MNKRKEKNNYKALDKVDKDKLYLGEDYCSKLFEKLPAIYKYKGIETLVQIYTYNFNKLQLKPYYIEHDLGNGCGMSVDIDTLEFINETNKEFIKRI